MFSVCPGAMPLAQLAPLAALPELTGVYLFCLIVGGGLLVISTTLGGHHDVEVDAGGSLDGGLGGGLDGGLEIDAGDVDGLAGADVGAGGVSGHEVAHDGGALGLSNWLSVRFVVYFLAAFGLVGTVLTYFTELRPVWILGLALIAGVCMGQFVHQVIRTLQRNSVSSESRVEDIVNQPGRVTVAVRPPARGEVGVRVGDREIFLPAIAQRGDDVFEAGAQVMITSYSSGLAEVVSRKEYEFTHNA